MAWGVCTFSPIPATVPLGSVIAAVVASPRRLPPSSSLLVPQRLHRIETRCLARGYSPNSTPVRIEATTAAMTDPSGTVAGIGLKVRTPQATPAPSAIPMRQPISVRVAASTRN